MDPTESGEGEGRVCGCVHSNKVNSGPVMFTDLCLAVTVSLVPLTSVTTTKLLFLIDFCLLSSSTDPINYVTMYILIFCHAVTSVIKYQTTLVV